jgi:hypothetical protein
MEVHHRLLRPIRARIFAKTEGRASVKNASAVRDSPERLAKMVGNNFKLLEMLLSRENLKKKKKK